MILIIFYTFNKSVIKLIFDLFINYYQYKINRTDIMDTIDIMHKINNQELKFHNILYDISEITVKLDNKNYKNKNKKKIKVNYNGNSNIIKTKSKIIENTSKTGQNILQLLGYELNNELVLIYTKIIYNTCLFCKSHVYDLNILDFRNYNNIIIHNYEIYPVSNFSVRYGTEIIYTFASKL